MRLLLNHVAAAGGSYTNHKKDLAALKSLQTGVLVPIDAPFGTECKVHSANSITLYNIRDVGTLQAFFVKKLNIIDLNDSKQKKNAPKVISSYGSKTNSKYSF